MVLPISAMSAMGDSVDCSTSGASVTPETEAIWPKAISRHRPTTTNLVMVRSRDFLSRTHWDRILLTIVLKPSISGGPQTEVSFAELLGERRDPSFLCAVYKRFWPKARLGRKRASDPESQSSLFLRNWGL